MKKGTPPGWDKERSRDTGCHVHPECLSCPLPRCIYEGGVAPDPVREARDRLIVLSYRRGETIMVIAQGFHLSERSVYRRLQRAGVKVKG